MLPRSTRRSPTATTELTSHDPLCTYNRRSNTHAHARASVARSQWCVVFLGLFLFHRHVSTSLAHPSTYAGAADGALAGRTAGRSTSVVMRSPASRGAAPPATETVGNLPRLAAPGAALTGGGACSCTAPPSHAFKRPHFFQGPAPTGRPLSAPPHRRHRAAAPTLDDNIRQRRTVVWKQDSARAAVGLGADGAPVGQRTV